ncbi:MAG: hypothetical protein ABI782_08365 [Anaerolineaceae bacterium]
MDPLGWAAFWAGIGTSVPLTALLLAMFGDASASGIVFGVKLFVVLAVIPILTVLGLGLFGALLSGNGVVSRITLTPEGCAVAVKEQGLLGSIENVALTVGSSYANSRSTASAVVALLASEGDTKWKDVRRVEADARRHVISLRRRWHNPLRLYVPSEQFQETAQFVQAHVPRPSPAGGSSSA